MSAFIDRAQNAAVNVSDHLQRAAGDISSQLQTTTDRLVPPSRREQMLNDVRAFSNRNPKLATFLAAQIALTAIPVLLFILFTTSTLFISLSTCLLFAITTALTYTFFAAGIALFFLVPTLFVASFAASCAFLWGLAIYAILRRFNEGEEPTKRGTRVGDRIHGLTAGRLGYLGGGHGTSKVEVAQAQDVSLADKAAHRANKDTTHASTATSCLGGAGSAHQVGVGHVKVDGEWETKWVHGTHLKKTEFGNGLDVKIHTVPIDGHVSG